MSVAESLERTALTFQRLLAQPADHYIDLETSDNTTFGVLVTPAGALVSLIEIRGAKSTVTSEWFDQAIQVISEQLRSRLDSSGHDIQFTFTYGAKSSRQDALDAISSIRTGARNIGADMDGMLIEWAESVSRYTSTEDVMISIWTKPTILPPAESKNARKRRGVAVKNAPQGHDAMNVASCIDALRDRHSAFCQSVISGFASISVMCRQLDAHEACHWIRSELDRTFTSKDWSASLPGDIPPLRVDWGDEDDIPLLYPALPGQLMPRDAEKVTPKIVRIGDFYHKPFLLKVPPRNEKPFNQLFNRIIQAPFPMRVSIRLSGDGLKGRIINRTLAKVFSVTSSENRQFDNAIQGLDKYVENGGCVPGLTAEFDTWVHINHPAAKNILSERAENLVAAVQSWGACDVAEATGDPLLGVTSSIAGATPGSPAPRAAGPLPRLARMLPFTRPVRFWDKGIPMRSTDGKLTPMEVGSKDQTAWIDLTAAPLGRGKSVTNNVLNLVHLLKPGFNECPYLSIMDAGESSVGVYETLIDSLPEHLHHLAVHRRLRNRVEDSINPLDLPLGCTYPLPVHEDFLRNFICQLATPMDRSSPPDGILGMATKCIKRAYEDFSPRRKPKYYTTGVDIDVDKKLAALGFEPNGPISWYAITRVLLHLPQEGIARD